MYAEFGVLGFRGLGFGMGFRRILCGSLLQNDTSLWGAFWALGFRAYGIGYVQQVHALMQSAWLEVVARWRSVQ